MPIGTPFHPRTSLLNQTQEWGDWSGYFGAGLYEMYHEREYWAIRNSAALFDVSPLFKYEFSGPDATKAVQRIMTRDMSKCKVGQVFYTAWCDDNGHIIDDGTISRLSDNHYRVTAADPSFRWFDDCAYGMDVEIKDVSPELAALSLQGPNSRAILETFTPNISELKYFRLGNTLFNDIPLTITRTGYTGDLGYELWVAPEHATALWDFLIEKGEAYGIMPAGLAALDIARMEAGLILIDVDYVAAPKAFIPQQKSSPFEAGLGWVVKFNKGNDFVGRKALEAEAACEPEWITIGLDIDWVSLEEIYGKVDLPPQVTGRSNRNSVPIFFEGRQVGYATSHTFSPILKKYIALATIKAEYGKIGTELEIEFTVEHKREKAKATVVKMPFFNPERKRK